MHGGEAGSVDDALGAPTTRVLIAGWAVATGVGLVLDGDRAHTARLVVQALALLGIAWWLFVRPEVRRLFAALPRAGRTATGIALGAMLAAQLAGRAELTFPLGHWDMYGYRLATDSQYLEFSGVTADGREVWLEIPREFPALERNVTTGLFLFALRVDKATDPAVAARLDATFGETVRVLARRHNAAHADAAIVTVRVWRTTVPSSPFRGADTIVRRLYRELAVG
jgi:hypothetical protein